MTGLDRTGLDRAAAWERDVVENPHNHCVTVRQAVARQISDLETSRHYRFDAHLAERPIKFIERLPWVKGRSHAGNTVVLAGWQCWWVATAFGWVDEHGMRRFSEAQMWVPRKNGKSTVAAAIALYLLIADGELAPEVYVAATKMEQARIVAEIAFAMARQTPALVRAGGLSLTGNSSARPPHLATARGGILRPLARDQSGSQDGLDVSGAVVDEIHAHPSTHLYDALAQATGARRQPLLLVTSTAGFNADGIGRQRYDALKSVLDGRQRNDHLFGVIWAADAGDDWNDEAAWARANPNLGISVTRKSLRALHTDACNTGAGAAFRVKRLNRWEAATREWMDMTQWRRCARPGLAPNAGERVWAGVHVSPGAETSAGCAMWFADEVWCSAFRVWLPADGVRAQFEPWLASGALVRSGSHSVRLDDVAEWLESLGDGLAAVCLDPRASGPLASVWDPRGLPCVDVLTTPANVSYPMRRWQAAIAGGTAAHDANPVAEWMVGNVVETLRGDGAVSSPSRVSRDARIDAVIAQLLAAAVALGWRDEPEPEPGRFIDLS